MKRGKSEMNYKEALEKIEKECGFKSLDIRNNFEDEVYVRVAPENYNKLCLGLHKELDSPVMAFFAVDSRQGAGGFDLYCGFESAAHKKWFFAVMNLAGNAGSFDSLSKEIYSSNYFEREIREMFGLEPAGNPDARRLNLHNEVWPEGSYPLRKDFKAGAAGVLPEAGYEFRKIEGEGVFEVPVGPVHAGIIPPGHFRFSVAGEPIINLEIRLGFTHKGTEKLFEKKNPADALGLCEGVSGDAVFAHSLAFSRAVEKICGLYVPKEAEYARAAYLELERMYNHVSDIGGIALDVGFSFPSAFCSLLKESMLALNEKLTGSRYLKKTNIIGGVSKAFSDRDRKDILTLMGGISKDFSELKEILYSSSSFMDRVETTGVLNRKVAADLGIVGPAARASGIPFDLRNDFPPDIYKEAKFKPAKQSHGDVLARLNVRIAEFEESVRLIREFIMMRDAGRQGKVNTAFDRVKPGCALGYAESWRGPVLYWVKIDDSETIERCKIVDPSFHNWQGLAFAVQNNIIPDFPLCNKSFNLSYSGNDL